MHKSKVLTTSRSDRSFVRCLTSWHYARLIAVQSVSSQFLEKRVRWIYRGQGCRVPVDRAMDATYLLIASSMTSTWLLVKP